MKNSSNYVEDALFSILIAILALALIMYPLSNSTGDLSQITLFVLIALIIFCTRRIIRKINYLIELIEKK